MVYPPNSYFRPGDFKTWVSGPLDWDTGTRCYFNSGLSTAGVTASTNATLTIYLRLLLVQRNKDSGIPLKGEDGKDAKIRDWDETNQEFPKFKAAVKTEGEKFWNSTGFCLIVSDDYRGLDWPTSRPTVHPNVDCRFEIVWASGPADAHAVIDCFRPEDNDFQLSSFRSAVGGGKGMFSAFDVLLRNSDLTTACETKDFVFTGSGDSMEYKTVKKRCAVKHMTLAHELGHLIGLPHVGQFRKVADCMDAIKKDPVHGNGASSCYNGPGAQDGENIMGQGMQVADWNAMPWALRLVDHLSIDPHGVRIALRKVLPRAVS